MSSTGAEARIRGFRTQPPPASPIFAVPKETGPGSTSRSRRGADPLHAALLCSDPVGTRLHLCCNHSHPPRVGSAGTPRSKGSEDPPAQSRPRKPSPVPAASARAGPRPLPRHRPPPLPRPRAHAVSCSGHTKNHAQKRLASRDRYRRRRPRPNHRFRFRGCLERKRRQAWGSGLVESRRWEGLAASSNR